MGAFAVAVGLTACNNKPDDSKEAAEEINEEVIDDRKGEKEAQFLVEAADFNLMEVQMGKMAANQATMKVVKDFGAKIEKEHQKVYDELAALAASKNITIPSSSSEDVMEHQKDLGGKTGYDFDRKFCDDMIDGHEKAINKFEKISNDCEDAEIKAWASKMLPAFNAHLAEAKILKEKVKDMK